jgi:hypothetical protein
MVVLVTVVTMSLLDTMGSMVTLFDIVVLVIFTTTVALVTKVVFPCRSLRSAKLAHLLKIRPVNLFAIVSLYHFH